jgi:phage terminase large subunit-like protein
MLRTGTRLQSQVCETQVIVVKAAGSLNDLRAGGHPMVPIGAATASNENLDPDWAAGNVMGKRYVDEHGAEILVTKAGEGTLSTGDVAMPVKEAKPLPASD